jgi:hypothetical protein
MKAKSVNGLFRKASNWIKGYSMGAYTEKGDFTTAIKNKDATCFCLSGAVRHVYPVSEREQVFQRIGKAIADLGFLKRALRSEHDVIRWNDSQRTKFEMVKAVVKKARV